MLFQETTTDLSIRFLKGSYIFFSELNLELTIDAKLARLSGCSLGLLNMRCTQPPLSNLSRSQMSWLMIICCWLLGVPWQPHTAALGVIYLPIRRENNIDLQPALFYMKWRTTKHNEILNTNDCMQAYAELPLHCVTTLLFACIVLLHLP